MVLFLLSSNAFCSLDKNLLIRGTVTTTYSNNKYTSVKDIYNQEYLLPLKSLVFVNKKKSKFVAEISIKEMKRIEKYCFKNIQINKKLCFR